MKQNDCIKFGLRRVGSYFLFAFAVVGLQTNSWADPKQEYLTTVTNQIMERIETAYQEYYSLVTSQTNDFEEQQSFLISFNNNLDPKAKDLMEKIEVLIANDEVDLSLGARIDLANLILSTQLDTEFKGAKILHDIKVDRENVLKKCYECGKKTNHLDCPCRCGHAFCKQHFLPEEHNCTFDYKSQFDSKSWSIEQTSYQKHRLEQI